MVSEHLRGTLHDYDLGWAPLEGRSEDGPIEAFPDGHPPSGVDVLDWCHMVAAFTDATASSIFHRYLIDYAHSKRARPLPDVVKELELSSTTVRRWVKAGHLWAERRLVVWHDDHPRWVYHVDPMQVSAVAKMSRKQRYQGTQERAKARERI